MEKTYSKEFLLSLYDGLKTFRCYVLKMHEAVYKGLIRSSCHSPYGQEATAIAALAAVRDTDWLCPKHRAQAVYYSRYDLQGLISEMLGSDDGLRHGAAYDFHLMDVGEDSARILSGSGTLGSVEAQNVGFAWARKYLGHDDEVVVQWSGEGSASEGVSYEAWCNAALYKPNMVFIIETNQWALSTPLYRESANPNISEKAAACGLSAEIVEDGTDILACYEAIQRAVDKARTGEPCVVEIKNRRWSAHFEGQPNDFREDIDKVHEAQAGPGDPVQRFEKYLLEHGVADQEYFDKKAAEVNAMMDEVILKASDVKPPVYEHLFNKNFVYATPETGGDL